MAKASRQRRVNFPLDDPRYERLNAYFDYLDEHKIPAGPIIAELTNEQFRLQTEGKSVTMMDLPLPMRENPVIEDTDPDALGDALGASW